MMLNSCESFIDGCLGEAVEAKTLLRASARVSDPALRKMLARTAHEEGQHAALAWEIVEWCVRRDGLETKVALHGSILGLKTFHSAPAEPTTEGRSASVCALMGRLLPAEELALRRAVAEESGIKLKGLLN
jgi:hypothetical protein